MFGLFEEKVELSPLAMGMVSGYLRMFDAFVNTEQFVKTGVNGERVYDADAQMNAMLSAPAKGYALGTALTRILKSVEEDEVTAEEQCTYKDELIQKMLYTASQDSEYAIANMKSHAVIEDEHLLCIMDGYYIVTSGRHHISDIIAMDKMTVSKVSEDIYLKVYETYGKGTTVEVYAPVIGVMMIGYAPRKEERISLSSFSCYVGSVPPKPQAKPQPQEATPQPEEQPVPEEPKQSTPLADITNLIQTQDKLDQVAEAMEMVAMLQQNEAHVTSNTVPTGKNGGVKFQEEAPAIVN